MKKDKNFIKEINLKLYLIWILFYIISIFLFNFMSSGKNIVLLTFWLVVAVWFFNISWIFLYKALNTKKEFWKILFSFLNIIIFSFFVFITIIK